MPNHSCTKKAHAGDDTLRHAAGDRNIRTYTDDHASRQHRRTERDPRMCARACRFVAQIAIASPRRAVIFSNSCSGILHSHLLQRAVAESIKPQH